MFITRTIWMCARSAPCPHEIVPKSFSFYYFRIHPWSLVFFCLVVITGACLSHIVLLARVNVVCMVRRTPLSSVHASTMSTLSRLDKRKINKFKVFALYPFPIFYKSGNCLGSCYGFGTQRLLVVGLPERIQ